MARCAFSQLPVVNCVHLNECSLISVTGTGLG